MAARVPSSGVTPSQPLLFDAYDLDEDFLDPITLKPLTEAVGLSCGHSFNQETIDALKQRNWPCPLDQEKIEQTFPNKVLSKIVQSKVRAIPIAPPQANDEISTSAEALFKRGKEHYDRFDYVQAATAFLGALILSPRYTKAEVFLDSSLEKQQEGRALPIRANSAPTIPSAALPHLRQSSDSQAKPTANKPTSSSLPPLYSAPPPQSLAPVIVNNYSYDYSSRGPGVVISNTHTNTYSPVYAPHDSSSTSIQQTYAPQFVYAPVSNKKSYTSVNASNNSRTYYTPAAASASSVPSGSQAHERRDTGSSFDFSKMGVQLSSVTAPRLSPQPSLAQGTAVSSNAKPDLPEYVLRASNGKARGRALIKAIEERNGAAINYLLKEKTDVNAKDANGRTSLSAACETNLPDILQQLIDHGADTQENAAQVALVNATKAGYAPIVEILLNENVPVMIRLSELSRTFRCEALEVAVKKGDVAIVTLILKNRNKPSGVKLENNYTYSWAVDGNYDGRFAIDIGRHVLNIACQEQNLEVARLLLDAGATIGEGLCFAAEKGNLKMIELLCDKRYKNLIYSEYSSDIFCPEYRLTISLGLGDRGYFSSSQFTFLEKALFVAIQRKHSKIAECLYKIVGLDRSEIHDTTDQSAKRPRLTIREIASMLERKNTLKD